MEAPDFDKLAASIEAAMVHEKAMVQIMTLAVEYEQKNITAERFAIRSCEIIKDSYSKFVKKDA